MVAKKNVRAWWGVLAAIGAACVGTQAWGAVSDVEDLSGCALPNGVVVIPAVAGQSGAEATAGGGAKSGDKHGTLLKISSRTLVAYPEAAGGKVLTRSEAMDQIKASKEADLAYVPEGKGGGLWAFSGAICDVTEDVFLSDASGQKLNAPMALPHTSKNAAGLLTGAEEGHVYLLQTTDNRFALLRVLELAKTGAVIQFVYQPAAGMSFEIPHNAVLAYKSPAELHPEARAAPVVAAAPVHDDASASVTPDPVGGPKVATIGPLPDAVDPYAGASATADTAGPAPGDQGPLARVGDVKTDMDAARQRAAESLLAQANHTPLGPGDYVGPGVIMLTSGAQASPDNLESTMASFNTLRSQMIQRRMDIIKKPANTDLDRDTKAQAIRDLPMLRATESVDLLVDQVSFLYTRSPDKEFSPDALHPCVGALKALGKPAVDAAIRGLEKLDLEKGEGIDSGRYKADLLAMVVVSVEGHDVAQLLFKKELDRASDPKAHAVIAYVLGKLDAQ